MCGIAGFFTGQPTSADLLNAKAGEMADRMVHRGPDDRGTWAEPAVGLAFGFRRLAIIDLSENGHQPMVSHSGQSALVFNGEVYNFRDLRGELEAHGTRFRGHSDTEVILEALERWGVEETLPRLAGMFSIAFWDSTKRRLTLARDRLGIKPLFVYSRSGLVSFASELKALVSGPSFDRTLDVDSVSEFLRYLYVPAPNTIFANVIKLLPGHWIDIDDPSQPLPEPRAYWSLNDVVTGNAKRVVGSEREILDRFDGLLSDAVRSRLYADVPVGALLSGGIDSSAVVALAQENSPRPIKTFTIGFDDPEHNEADQAKSIASHLGTEHRELMVTGQDALDVVPQLADMFDEPLANPSQIPTYLVSALARQEVAVALSGDGGDELFGGYNRYISGHRLLANVERIPRGARHFAAMGLGVLSPGSWSRLHASVTSALGRKSGHRLVGEKLGKVATLLRMDSFADRYRSLMSAWQVPRELVPAAGSRETVLDQVLRSASPKRPLDRMMLGDQLTYLPDDLLAKVDRASMAISLEVRVPLLDHRLAELAWRLPDDLKIRGNTGKWALRQVAYRRVPKALLDRPKMGFTVPIDGWLQGPLRPWADDLVHSQIGGSYLDQRRLAVGWKRYQETGHGGLRFWAVLMLLGWIDRWAAPVPDLAPTPVQT